MQLAIASTQPQNVSAVATTPVELAVNDFIGKDLLRVNWNDFGKTKPQLAGIAGARAGYESLSDAIGFASTSAAKNLELDSKGLVQAGTSYAVVEAADRFAVVSLNELLATRWNGKNYRAADYETRRSGFGDAIRAVIDGYGNVLNKAGRFGF